MVQQVGLPIRRQRVSVKATALQGRGQGHHLVAGLQPQAPPPQQHDGLPAVLSSRNAPKFPPFRQSGHASGYVTTNLPAAPIAPMSIEAQASHAANVLRHSAVLADGGGTRAGFGRGPSLPCLGLSHAVSEEGSEVATSYASGSFPSDPRHAPSGVHDNRRTGALPPLGRGFNSYEVTNRSPCETPSDLLPYDDESEACDSFQSCELIDEASFHFSPEQQAEAVGIVGASPAGKGHAVDDCDMSVAQALDAAGLDMLAGTAFGLLEFDGLGRDASSEIEVIPMHEPAQPVVPPLAFVPASEFQLAENAGAPRSASCTPATDGAARGHDASSARIGRSWRLPTEISQRREWRVTESRQDRPEGQYPGSLCAEISDIRT
mmetsp:Transcript_48373/g.89051  ORF Transcript_48373/g.89051 Transcript_48373/m.89051 type:complete len:377 (-) Transcript_48373:203-1333(-)